MAKLRKYDYICKTGYIIKNMAQYIVSARKYRPDSFESLIGQDNIVQTLKNSVIRGQLAHAYLFCGPRGVGKTSAARIFAKIINCSSPSSEMEPCGKCESCISFQEGRSYCIHELDAASNNGVDDIKALIDQVNIPPQIGKYSVYIVDEVHMLSQSAFNAFLKTLEEPPAHAIFILATTEKHKILPTILSRCQTYDFNRISIPDIVRNLKEIASKEGVEIGDEALHIIASKADGAMRDALTIFDQTIAFCGNKVDYSEVIKNLNILDYEHCFGLVDDFLAGDYQAALLKFDNVLSKGFNALHFMSALSSHLRELLVTRSGGLDALLELPESLKKRYAKQASRCSIQFLYEAMGITMQCESGYRLSINPRLHIEFALMRLSFLLKDRAGATAGNSPKAQEARQGGEASQPKAHESSKPNTVPEKGAASEKEGGNPQPAEKRGVTEGEIGNKTGGSEAAQKEAEVKDEAQANAGETKASAEEVAQATTEEAKAGKEEAAQNVADTKAGIKDANKAEEKVAEYGRNEAETELAAKTTKARKRPAKLATSLSISSIKEEDAQEKSATSSLSALQDKPAPEDEKIIACWKSIPEEYKSRPRLATTLTSSKIEIEEKEDKKFVTFFVVNTAQQQWIEEKLLNELEQKLQKLTGSIKLRLLVSVMEEELTEKRLHLPKDQAIELINKNPEVRDLVKDLDLDIKI